ncbi:hypothetical protein LEN26_007904 [Aphanomyces euteiches]|nr:hypothetical protein LEN26_007904 [Aphanomyces euteiches]
MSYEIPIDTRTDPFLEQCKRRCSEHQVIRRDETASVKPNDWAVMTQHPSPEETILLEAVFQSAQSLLKPRKGAKRPIPLSSSSSRGSGQAQLIRHANGRYSIRFLDLIVHNTKRQHLYVLLCREKVSLVNKAFLATFERHAERLLLADGPNGGQLKGCHFFQRTFNHTLDLMDVRRYKSIVICKPATAKPPSVIADVHLFANWMPYAHLTREVAPPPEILVAKSAKSSGDNLQEIELDIDALKKHAHELFVMFDQDRSGLVDFTEFQAMLAYRQVDVLEPQAKRLFNLVDLDKAGAIDEEQFIAALYMTNYLKAHQVNPHITPADAFALLDEDRDGLLNVVEYEHALQVLGVKARKAHILRLFPSDARLISLDQFVQVWCALIRVKDELLKRGIPLPPRSFNYFKDKKQLKACLLAALEAQAAKEVESAIEAREVVVGIGRQLQAERQMKRWHLKHLKRSDELVTKTKEAIRERDEKIQRKKERNARLKLQQDERRLVAQVADDKERRKQKLLQVHMEALVARRGAADQRRAARGDDILDLATRRLEAIPNDFFHGKDQILALSNMVIVDLARNKLTALPSAFVYHLDSAEEVDLSYNRLESLPDEIGQLQAVRLLNLRGNQLTSLPSTLTKLSKLEILDVASNQLESIQEDDPRSAASWKNLRSLRMLFLTDNRLKTLPPDFATLPVLEHLDLVGNPMPRLPLTFSALQTLLYVDLSSCGLQHLSTEFGQHPHCLVVNLRRNGLSHLPPSVDQLSAMQDLDVSDNDLLALPEAVGGWTALVRLVATRNRIRILPPSIGDWKSVEVVDLSHNRIEELPPTIGWLSLLHTLNLRDNALETLPLEIGALVHLRHLNLAHNHLTAIPSQMGFCHALVTVDLSENALETLPPTVGMWMALEKLHLHKNRLVSPLPDTIDDWHELQVLDLSHNALTHLDRTICTLARLECLNLAANRIAYLPVEIGNITSLRTLDLYNNALEALPIELDRLVPTLEVLHLDRNPLGALPEKWCTRWRLRDLYRTQFAHGYSSPEALEWTSDHAVYYPAVVAAWNAAAEQFLAHELLVAAFLDDVRQRLGAAWLPRFEKPVKTHFFEFKCQGHASVYDDVDDDEWEEQAEQEAALQASRDLQLVTVIRPKIDEWNERRSKSYAVNVVDAQAESELKRARHEEHKAMQAHAEAQSLLEYVDKRKPAQEDVARRLSQHKRHSFVELMKRKAIEREQLARKSSNDVESIGGLSALSFVDARVE